jgi:hypothetical protein
MNPYANSGPPSRSASPGPHFNHHQQQHHQMSMNSNPHPHPPAPPRSNYAHSDMSSEVGSEYSAPTNYQGSRNGSVGDYRVYGQGRR